MYWLFRIVIGALMLYCAWVMWMYVIGVILAIFVIYWVVKVVGLLIAAVVGSVRAKRESKEAW